MKKGDISWDISPLAWFTTIPHLLIHYVQCYGLQALVYFVPHPARYRRMTVWYYLQSTRLLLMLKLSLLYPLDDRASKWKRVEPSISGLILASIAVSQTLFSENNLRDSGFLGLIFIWLSVWVLPQSITSRTPPTLCKCAFNPSKHLVRKWLAKRLLMPSSRLVDCYINRYHFQFF